MNGRDLVTWKRKNVLENVERRMAEVFGGFTEYETIGGWQSGKKLMKERVTILKVFYNAAEVTAPFSIVEKLARLVKLRLNQEAVTIEQDGGISFI